jgi:aquacobalamin reductase/NAD(P)H-flavin reductase
MQRIKCRVEELREYVDTIWHVALAPQQEVSFKPGQYLLVVMSDSDKRPFSIANSPTRSGVLELQIGATPENAYAGQVLARMREQGRSRSSWPLARRSCATNPRPLILMAGGTGFSYARAILEYLIGGGSKRPVFLYWGYARRTGSTSWSRCSSGSATTRR